QGVGWGGGEGSHDVAHRADATGPFTPELRFSARLVLPVAARGLPHLLHDGGILVALLVHAHPFLHGTRVLPRNSGGDGVVLSDLYLALGILGSPVGGFQALGETLCQG